MNYRASRGSTTSRVVGTITGVVVAGLVLFIFWVGGVDLDKRNPVLGFVLYLSLFVGAASYALVQMGYKE